MVSDFTASLDVSGTFVKTELDSGVDFIQTGDLGQIIISTSVGFGEGGFGEGGFGGDTTTLILNASPTSWANEAQGSVDFTETGDFGQIVVSGSVGFGEGGFGEGGFGGDTTTLVLGIGTTIWRNIDTP